jgi:hypothetical protein
MAALSRAKSPLAIDERRTQAASARIPGFIHNRQGCDGISDRTRSGLWRVLSVSFGLQNRLVIERE